MPANRYSKSMVSAAFGFKEVPPKSDDLFGEEEPIVRPNDVYQHQDTFEVEFSAFGEEQYIPRYKNKPKYDDFKANDFQIGSVRLTAPIAVGVERLRDIHVTPVLRGQAIASKASASVVRITLTMDFPDPYSIDNELKPLLAELKTCPFTKLRSYDMAVKLSGVEGFKVNDETRQAQLNVITAELTTARLKSLFAPLMNVKKENSELLVGTSWQDAIGRAVSDIIGEVVDGKKRSQSAGELASSIIVSVSAIISSNRSAIITQAGQKVYDKLAKEWTAESSSQGHTRIFGDELQAKQKIATTHFKDLLDAVESENQINQEARESHDDLPLMNGFVPVVCQQVSLSSIPDRSGAFRVNFTFEYFFHDNYVSKMLYHSFNDETGWDLTEDPAEADLLLRWRDIQYLGTEGLSNVSGEGVPIRNESKPRDPSDVLYDLNERVDGIPGFLSRMQQARFERVCRSFPSDPQSHGLNVYYPESMPQIEKNAQSTNTNAVYKGIIVDTADAITDGIVCNVQVIWNFNIARHPDEHNGVVRHQWAGGATLSASFELCIPHDGLPDNIVEGGRVLLGNDADSDETNSYARLLGRINNMFATMERNRKLLPSDAFVPTSVFVDNPITSLFGAYVFELKDIPVFQSDPGRVTTVLNFVESLPVIGLAGDSNHDDTPTSNKAVFDLDNLRATDKMKALIEAAKSGSGTAVGYLTGTLERLAQQTLYGIIQHKRFRSKTSWVQQLLDTNQFNEDRQPNEIQGFNRNFLRSNLHEGQNINDAVIEDMAKIFRAVLLGNESPWVTSEISTRLAVALDQKPDLLNDNINSASFSARILDESYSKFMSIALLELGINSTTTVRILNAAGVVIPEAVDTAEYVLQNEFKDKATDVLTQQLYPDMVLPRYFEVLGIDPDEELPDELALKFIPSMAETGKMDYGNNGHLIPSRTLYDIADPDVYFARERTFLDKAKEFGFTTTHKGPDGDPNTIVNPRFNTIQDDDTTPLRAQSSVAGKDNEKVNVIDAPDSVIASGWAELEAQLQPNDRRMLYAFPTYSMEFFLDIQHSKPDPTTGIVAPGTTSHFEARLFNVLPMIDIETYENVGDRPNIAQLTFIARRAGLRNNSWKFLPPKHARTIYDEEGRLRFTNDPDMVEEHLNQHSTYKSDPLLLTSKLLIGGTRCVIKLGYGTDLNNPRMLPHKINGTIAEISLGEISQMVVQSFGTQLANPLNTEIGGSGRYSPNKTLSGSLTLRAFSDIFHALDMRFMGRTGRGIDIDARSLSNVELKRIRDITYQTRTVLGTAAQAALNILDRYVNASSGWYNDINPIVMSARALESMLESGGFGNDRNFLDDVSKGHLDPFRSFYPEFLNVKGPPIGISDWAISNTSTKNLSAATWVDMITRLNPGTVWWPHTYGDEVRLFWGKPESVFRADPGTLSPELSALTLQFMRTQVKNTTKNVYQTLRERIELDRYSTLLKDADGNVVSRYSPGYAEDLTNPREKRTIADHIDFLLSQSLTQDSVARLIRKLMVAKTNDIQKGIRFINDVAKADGATGADLVSSPAEAQELNAYLQGLVNNSYNHIFPAGKPGFTQGSTSVAGSTAEFDEGTKLRLRLGGSKGRGTDRTMDELKELLAEDSVFQFRFSSHESFLNVLTSLERLDWNQIDEDALARLSIVTADIASPDSGSEAVNFIKSLFGGVGFGVEQLKAVRFLIERVVIDLNYLYRDTSKDAEPRILDDSLSPSVSAASIASTKALRSMRMNGYRPFRNSHLIMSGQKLMASHIEATQAYMANAISYDGYTVGYNVLAEERRVMDLDSEMSKLNFGVFEWFKGLVGKTERDRVVDVLFPSMLAKGLSKMYQGELVLIGDPYIKPHDVVYTLDLHNGVYGPLCCETVINKLSVQTGLTTIIRPAALTQAQSSRFLTDHLVRQRQMKTVVGGLLLAGIAAAFIPGVGIPLAGLLGTTAAVGGGIVDIMDTYGRLRLENVAVTDPINKSLLEGEGPNTRTVEDLVNTIMVESYVSGTGLQSTGMAQDRDELLSRIRNAKDELTAAQLGVSMIPLKRLATHTPLVAGLRTRGFDTIDMPSVAEAVEEGVSKPFYPVERAVADMKIMVGDTIQDFSTGWEYIHMAAAEAAKETERLKNLFRERGIEIE